MTKLEQIEKAVEALSEDELRAFSEWFETMQQSRWDHVFTDDVKTGRLDRLADEALADFRSGKTRPI